jgi:UDP-N-acetylglucosamine 2-epimerase
VAADCPSRARGKLRFADIWLVIGTRPEAIKQPPVARALQFRGFTPLLVLTGQQPLDVR